MRWIVRGHLAGVDTPILDLETESWGMRLFGDILKEGIEIFIGRLVMEGNLPINGD